MDCVVCAAVVCDVTDERQVRNLANTVLSKYEQVDVLVNNAGVMTRGAFSQVPASVSVGTLARTAHHGTFGMHKVLHTLMCGPRWAHARACTRALHGVL